MWMFWGICMAVPEKTQQQRGLTIRSFIVCLVAMFMMGIWIEYEELYNTYGGPLGENSPANSAVGIICAVLIISGALYKLRKSLRLATAELVVIYAALILAAPLMTQGLWHRFFGLVTGIPHYQDFKSYESLPPMLWPHGENLAANGRFERGIDGFVHVGGGTFDWSQVEWKNKLWKSPALSNGNNPDARATLALPLARRDKSGREILVPGESFLVTALVKADGFVGDSSYFIKMQADDGPIRPLLVNAESTRATFALPGGLHRIGVDPVIIPADLKDKLTLYFGIGGQGTLTIQDIQFFNIESVEGLYSGRKFVREENLAALGPSERDFTAVRPANMLSVAGTKYLVQGYIPLRQWFWPALTWTTLIGGLFIGFLGLNVLMRKQWAENERLTFPLTILPRQLFAEHDCNPFDLAQGKLAILRNKPMWLGFAFALPLVIWKGLKFYFPSLPGTTGEEVAFVNYVSNPLLKACLANVGIGIGTGLGLSMSVMAISLLIETDILFTLWATFVVFQLWNLFGKAFNFTATPGYPWEHQQTIGGFIAYAFLALFVGRQHLTKALRAAFGGEHMPEQSQEVASYRTAILMVAASFTTIALWAIWTKMGMLAGLLYFGYVLICGFALSKIRAEMGAPWGYIVPYFGMFFVNAIGGFAVFKSTGMLVATMASGFMCTACFLFIAPAQVEMMELGRHFNVKPRHVGAGLALGLLGGLFIGGFVMLCWGYGFGANNLKTTWPYDQNQYYDGFRGGELNADRALESGVNGKTPESQPLNFVSNPDAKGVGIGLVITVALAALRTHFTWFPFHPLGYVLASTFFMKSCWFYFFVAWLLRSILFRIGGAQTIRRGLAPFCVGMFLACLASIVIYDIAGILLRLSGITEIYCRIP